jgi:hypothetical protein
MSCALCKENSESKEGWESSRRSRELAAAFAWRDLCFAAGKGQADLFETAKTEIVAPFTNLATALDKVGEHTRLKKSTSPGSL